MGLGLWSECSGRASLEPDRLCPGSRGVVIKAQPG